MIATQFNNLSISCHNGNNGGVPSSPQSQIANTLKDDSNAAAASPSKKNKKGRKKTTTGQRPAVDTIDNESTFQNNSNRNDERMTTKRMMADVASSHVKNQAVHLNLENDVEESKSSPNNKPKKNSTTTPRKSKKKNRKNSKNKDGIAIWMDGMNAQQYSDYSTNAEGAAILASLGQFQFAPPGNNDGGYHTNTDCYNHSSESYGTMTTENDPYEVVPGPMPSEYYEGSSAAIAAMSYYYPQQPINHHVVHPAAVDTATSYPAPASMSSTTVQQPSLVVDMNPYPSTSYGMYYPYPMYYVPVHQVSMQENNGMYSCPPSQQQHQYDENTPPAMMDGNGGVVVMPTHYPITVQEKAKLNVDAPTFEPKKGGGQ